MDGAGKTTVTKNLVKTLNNEGINCFYLYTGRGNNNILPIRKAGDAYKKKESQNKLVKKTLYSLAAPIFALDLFIRYWIRVFPKRLKGIVITDRYASDLLLMPNVPYWIRRTLYLFFPKPHYIYVYNDVDELHKRRRHDINDLYRQEKLFEKINKVLKPKKIKSKTQEQTLKETLEYIKQILYVKKPNTPPSNKSVDTLFSYFKQKNILCVILDERWKQGGDIDVIVAKHSFKKLEQTLFKKGFVRKTGWWPLWCKTYVKDKIILGVHIGGYFGKGMLTISALSGLFEPKNNNKKYLFPEEQALILIYKKETRKSIHYDDYFSKLQLDAKRLEKLCSLLFKNPKQIRQEVMRKKTLSTITTKLKTTIILRHKTKKLAATLLRVIKL